MKHGKHRRSGDKKWTHHRMVQHFVAQPFTLSPEEIAQYTDPEIVKRIRDGGDKTPLFRAYAVGHEGDARGAFIEGGEKKFFTTKYLRPLIEKLHGALEVGAKVFHLHGKKSNSHAGREPIGEVVGKILHEVAGKLYNVAIAYIEPEHRNQKLDVASIEADVRYSRSGGEVTVDEICGVTGIALGSSDTVEPGFPGATLLGALQAFQEAPTGKDLHSMDIDEVNEWIRSEKIPIADLYGPKAIKGDASVRDLIKQHQSHASRVEQSLGEARTEFEEKETAWGAERTKLTEELGSLTKANLGFRARPILDSVLAERKLTPKASEFIGLNAANFMPVGEDEKAIKAEAGKFADDQLDAYKATAKLFGADAGDGSEKPGDKGAPSGDGGGTGGDLSLPGDNDFIPAPIPKLVGG